MSPVIFIVVTLIITNIITSIDSREDLELRVRQIAFRLHSKSVSTTRLRITETGPDRVGPIYQEPSWAKADVICNEIAFLTGPIPVTVDPRQQLDDDDDDEDDEDDDDTHPPQVGPTQGPLSRPQTGASSVPVEDIPPSWTSNCSGASSVPVEAVQPIVAPSPPKSLMTSFRQAEPAEVLDDFIPAGCGDGDVSTATVDIESQSKEFLNAFTACGVKQMVDRFPNDTFVSLSPLGAAQSSF
ncbi:hypothetical protein AK812_SmicGene35325 [Symbiodinium microadriaticum]|uniref:Uncharacterized protein n=1 Tax=Symbiodinium microadriaticum TaxID=2951 RepID=A0A1Q9CLQ9_SYMMI|nr:hypothetical protein AK812_SmicGene35325 [Symbiodinium microadriaticum]